MRSISALVLILFLSFNSSRALRVFSIDSLSLSRCKESSLDAFSAASLASASRSSWAFRLSRSSFFVAALSDFIFSSIFAAVLAFSRFSLAFLRSDSDNISALETISIAAFACSSIFSSLICALLFSASSIWEFVRSWPYLKKNTTAVNAKRHNPIRRLLCKSFIAFLYY